MFEWRDSIITQIDIPDVYQADRPLPSPLESQVLVIINTTTMILDVGLHVMDKIVPKFPGKPGNRSPVVSVDRGHGGMIPSPSWGYPCEYYQSCEQNLGLPIDRQSEIYDRDITEY